MFCANSTITRRHSIPFRKKWNSTAAVLVIWIDNCALPRRVRAVCVSIPTQVWITGCLSNRAACAPSVPWTCARGARTPRSRWTIVVRVCANRCLRAIIRLCSRPTTAGLTTTADSWWFSRKVTGCYLHNFRIYLVFSKTPFITYCASRTYSSIISPNYEVYGNYKIYF